MKKNVFIIILFNIIIICRLNAQDLISGFVLSSEDRLPINGVSVITIPSGFSTISDKDGVFRLPKSLAQDTIKFTALGYKIEYRLMRDLLLDKNIYLTREISVIEEVTINTGYYKIPKERATGSFVHIDSSMLHRIGGRNILERLEGLSAGVQFVNSGGTTASDIRIRGLSTIESDETPLIILDNFPYNGNINEIDPNNIENITILKDAAAASIWGAKAGNGVIVINSKGFISNRTPKITLYTYQNRAERPNLYYNPFWLSSQEVMNIEKERFQSGQYNHSDSRANTYYVEMLEMHKRNLIDDNKLIEIEERLKKVDLREHALQYLYQPLIESQYSFNIDGGSQKYGYHLSTTYDKRSEHVVRNGNERIHLSLRNWYKPIDKLNFNIGINYNDRKTFNNGININNLYSGLDPSPYLELVNNEMDFLSIPRSISYRYALGAEEIGLLDWEYRPLIELNLNSEELKTNEIQFNSGIQINLLKGLDFDIQYRYMLSSSNPQTVYHKDSYYVRDLVNRFTQSNGISVIPNNGIFVNGGLRNFQDQFGRGIFTYQQDFDNKGNISGIIGLDIHEGINRGIPGSRLYNYSPEYYIGGIALNYAQVYEQIPSGRSQIPRESVNSFKVVNRDISYYSNIAYNYLNRYMLSGSYRWDGSNLFGVKTNQKGVPLWSIGLAWDIAKEQFFFSYQNINQLRVRATYGVSGNINKTLTHSTVVDYRNTSNNYSYDYAVVMSLGNPSLRWERVNTLNIGLDWDIFNSRLRGEFEYYTKIGHDLIGDKFMDPTTGVLDHGTGIPGQYKINYADIKTQGWDFSIVSYNLKEPIQWKTSLSFSLVNNKIINYHVNEDVPLSRYFRKIAPPIIGKSRDVVYSIPWHGLSPVDGQPIVFLEGKLTTEYLDYYRSLTSEMLEDKGSLIPITYGSLRNQFKWKAWEMGFMLLWKLGYVYRRSSISPGDEYMGIYHEDYLKRWKSPGDEKNTDIPATIPLTDFIGQAVAIPSIYSNSSALIEPGDHIRFQDISIGYQFNNKIKYTPIKNFHISLHAKNLGVIWKKSNHRLDPNYIESDYPSPRSISLGINCVF